MTETKLPTVINVKETRADGYLLKYTLYEERATKEELSDMTGGSIPRAGNFYSIMIESENLSDKSDISRCMLPKMTTDLDRARFLLGFLCENTVTCEGVEDLIDDINRIVG